MDTRSLGKRFWSVVMCVVLAGAVSVTFAKVNEYGSTEKQRSEVTQEANKMMEKTTTCDIAGRAGELQSVRKATGSAVLNLQGERLGDIHELIVDRDNESVVYAILSDRSGKFYPVPWKAFVSGQKSYTLDVTTENFRQAPSIESVDIDRLSSPDLKQQVGDFYSKQISARETTGERAIGWMKEKTERVFGAGEKSGLYKCSVTIGTDIQNPKGEKIARLDDIVFDVREGNLAYGLASFGGYMGVAAKTAAVPWSAITLQHPEGIAKLDADRNTLETAVIAKGDLNRLNEPMFARQVHQSFGKEPYWEVLGYVPPTGAAAVEGLSASAWLPDSAYNKSFNPNTITTLEGTVTHVDVFTPEKGATEGLKLKVDTPEGETMVIHAGPQTYYMAQKIRFNDGDKITVTGSKARFGLKDVIIATEIKKGDETFKLRSEDGKPLWKVEMPAKPRMDTEIKPKDDMTKPEKESGTY